MPKATTKKPKAKAARKPKRDRPDRCTNPECGRVNYVIHEQDGVTADYQCNICLTRWKDKFYTKPIVPVAGDDKVTDAQKLARAGYRFNECGGSGYMVTHQALNLYPHGERYYGDNCYNDDSPSVSKPFATLEAAVAWAMKHHDANQPADNSGTAASA